MTDHTDFSDRAEGTLASFLKVNDPLGVFSRFDCETLGNAMDGTAMSLRFAPLEKLPCANHHFERNVFCQEPGKLPCNRCRLVSYCSQKCQREHKTVHKHVCNVPSPGKDTQVVQDQPIRFLDTTDCPIESPRPHGETMSMPMPLYANLPAVDIVNLPKNEKDRARDFSLAFVASGDLRNVIRTVNGLGADYTGRLNILLNDTSPSTVTRNIVLLLILGAMPNESVAADIALHFWYSIFLPEEHRLRILAMLALLLQQYTDRTEPLSVDLGPRSKLTCLVPQEITDHLLYTAGPTLSTSQAKEEYERVCTTPARLDSRNGMLEGMRHSHSLAFLEFWRSGVVLPFGAVREHHTPPNASFFSPLGTWLGNRVENPLASWDPNEVFKAGQAHGAQPEDIYGCLYFHLSDQLRTFAKRIRDLHITFHVFNTGPHTLAHGILGGEYSVYGLTPSIRFNRIDLANILEDGESAKDVLKSWASLLAEGETATIVGVFPDWANTHQVGRAVDAGEEVIASIVRKLQMFGRLPPETTSATAMSKEAHLLDAMYDNSKAFARYLKASRVGDAIRESMLKRRLKHKIIPHRIRLPVDAKSGDLPHLPDDETWYRYARLIKAPFSARYVELSRAT